MTVLFFSETVKSDNHTHNLAACMQKVYLPDIKTSNNHTRLLLNIVQIFTNDKTVIIPLYDITFDLSNLDQFFVFNPFSGRDPEGSAPYTV